VSSPRGVAPPPGALILRDNPELQRSGLTCDKTRSYSVHLPPSRGLVQVFLGHLAGQLGMTLEDWAEFYGVPDHVWWNVRPHHAVGHWARGR
jgi:hypothetical protein